ncbi:unnamed protein product [Lymnaea stagnalis]|uniref:Uncharacterized protein n=1 Tax=Lymnaea stagnalis TaxID=6523 RepID=A0AAV2I9S4_LYMST
MAEICAIRTYLLDVSIRLCAFHTATAVKYDLQQRKLHSPIISCILDLFAEQNSCSDLSQYNVLKDKISDISSPEVISSFTFNPTGGTVPQLWDASFVQSQIFQVNTTNHAEKFHQKRN